MIQTHRQQQMEAINKLCVKTYLDILGYHIWLHNGHSLAYHSPVRGYTAFAVYHFDNQFHCGNRRHQYRSGGVLDLAAAIFKVTKFEVFYHPERYKIDRLIKRCAGQTGPLWKRLDPDDLL